MKRILFLSLFMTFSYVVTYGQWCSTCPTNNPMATHYGDSGEYAFWTEEINWLVSIDMSTYSNGTTEFEKFKNARDELYNVGGGVLYYPAGTYTFDIPDGPNDEGLMLKKGVVLRGETPASDKIAVSNPDINTATRTDHGLKSLPTKIVFTTKDAASDFGVTVVEGNGKIPKMWNVIGAKAGANETDLGDVSHVGIAWIELQFGYIYFGVGADGWAATMGDGGYYSINPEWADRVPDGTSVLDMFCGHDTWGATVAHVPEKRFVFGCYLNNCMMPNYVFNKSGVSPWPFDDKGFFWGGKLGVYGEHLFIANNVIGFPTEVFAFEFPSCSDESVGDVAGTATLYFDYGYNLGIDVNKSAASGFWNRCAVNDPGGAKSLFYAEDVIIQDNFVYNHGNKSIEAAGKWMVIKNNLAPRDFLTWQGSAYDYLSTPQEAGRNNSNGRCHTGESADDLMSRFIDLGGWSMWVTKNKWQKTGTNYANDGESMLFQRHNGIEVYSCAMTHNRKWNGGGGDPGYIAPYDVHVVGLFQGWNVQPGGTGIAKTESNWGEDVSAPEGINWDLTGTPTSPGGASGTNIQDLLAICPATSLTKDDSVINLNITTNEVEYKTTITWTDNTANEIAFRVEKQSASLDEETDPWTVLAYRPRQETTTTSTSLRDIKPSSNLGPAPTDQCYPTDVMINDMNPTKWVDYKANIGGAFRYRVCAIDCDDDCDACPSGVIGIKVIESEELIAPQVIIKPNPVTSSSLIEYDIDEGETATVTLSDMQGKQVAVIADGITANSVNVSNSELNSGMYLVKVELSGENSKRATIKKMVVK